MPSKTHSYPEYATKIENYVRITKHPPDKQQSTTNNTKKQPCKAASNIVCIGRPQTVRTFVSIFLLVEEKVVFRRIIGPNILDGFVYLAFVLDLLQVFEHLQRRPRTHGIIDQLLFRRRPRCIFQFGSQLKCPIHNTSSKVLTSGQSLAYRLTKRSAVIGRSANIYKKREKQ